MNLLVFNLATDADDPILGFTSGWLNRLAPHYTRIDVITMRAGRLALAANVQVHSVGKERGWSEARRALTFYHLLSGLLLRRRYAACFAHMMPLFAVMGAPLLRPLGVPITLWYTHRQRHRTLAWAARVSRRVVSAAPDSFPIATPKLRVLGHGIDTDFFSPSADALPASPPTIVQVARLMPIKHQATLIRALTALPDARAVFVGDVPPEQGAAYRHDLEALARDLGVAQRVTFAGSLTADGVREAYRRAAAAVNLSPAGLFDKAALEALACGVPTVVSSAAFDGLIGGADWRIESPDDHVGLAARLAAALALDPAERARLTSAIRARTVEAHSLDGLIRSLMRVLHTGEMA